MDEWSIMGMETVMDGDCDRWVGTDGQMEM
jgi:hypothetical protein